MGDFTGKGECWYSVCLLSVLVMKEIPNVMVPRSLHLRSKPGQ